jgi:hypothetical protein
MVSPAARKKGGKLHYYVVESARVEAQPRIVRETCLGAAEKVTGLSRTAPPLVEIFTDAVRASAGANGLGWDFSPAPDRGLAIIRQ